MSGSAGHCPPPRVNSVSGWEPRSVHGCGFASFWKRGSLRNGSNIGSSRSNAGVSGGFAAKGASYGIESSFSNAEIDRSTSPMRAATRARISSGLGPVSASFSIGHHLYRALGQSQRSIVVTKSHICKCEISHQNNIFRLFFEERFQLGASLTPTFARSVVITTTSCAQANQKRSSPA